MPAPVRERPATRSSGSKRRLTSWWVTAAAVAAVLALTLTGTPGGTFAFWSESSPQPASLISAGSINAESTVSPSAAVTYSAGTTQKTGGLTIANTGTSDATYSTATTVSGSAPLASGVHVAVWPSTVLAGCATPVSPVTGTWSSFPVLTGALAAGASQFYCVRTTLTTPVGLASNTAITATFTTTMNRNSWRSTSTATVAQNFVDAAPSTPTNLTFSGTTTSSTTLNWTASTDDVAVTGYDIYYGSTLIGSTTGATSFAITGLASSTTYSYTVRAKDGAAHTSAAASASVTTLEATPPTGWYQLVNTKSGLCIDAKGAGTTNFSPLVQNTCGNPVQTNQTWSFSGPNADGYYTVIPRHTTAVVWDIEASSGNNAARVILYGPHSGVNQQWSVRLVAPDTYQFVARNSGKCMSVIGGSLAIDTGFEQVDCNSADPAQTFSFDLVDTVAPSTPTNLIRTGMTTTTATVRWTASTDNVGVTNYLVYRGATLAGTVSGSTLTFTDTGRTAGSTYTYTVRARDAAGNLSAASTAVTATLPSASTLSCTTTGSTVTFGWGNPSGTTNYFAVYLNDQKMATNLNSWIRSVQLSTAQVHAADVNGRVEVEVYQVRTDGSQTLMGRGFAIATVNAAGTNTVACG